MFFFLLLSIQNGADMPSSLAGGKGKVPLFPFPLYILSINLQIRELFLLLVDIHYNNTISFEPL